MIAKIAVVAHLGEEALLLPRRIHDALAANDRAKLRMTALQAAVRRARDPVETPVDLTEEARAAGLDPRGLADLLAGATALGSDAVSAPGVATLLEDLGRDVDVMIDALAAGRVEEAEAFRDRRRDLAPSLGVDGDAIAVERVRAITAAGGEADGLHRLVMDLHKRLNRLAAEHAEEEVDGARCSGLTPADRPLVAAFMRGVNTTRRLKFDHPGLDTTVARFGDRLSIQNDIGTTDAHVLCVTVRSAEITLTYTDVHRVRAAFFVSLFDPLPELVWSKPSERRVAGLAEGEAFHLVTATLASDDERVRARGLEAIGAALVFLIDWNKARKQLQRFVGKCEAVEILRRAAERRFGHRAFLEMGGAGLVEGAVQRVAAGRIGYGVRLDRALGARVAVDFLGQVLRIAAESLLAGRSDRLVRDGVDADLAGRLERSGSSLLQGVVAQAGLAHALAAGLAEAIAGRGGADRDVAAFATTAKRIEEKADRLALDLRLGAERFGLAAEVEPLIDAMEESIDALEEAAFYLSVLPPAEPGDRGDERLAGLATAAVRAAEAATRMADAASCVPEGHRADVEDALAALGDLVAIEHEADDLERAAIAAAL
ncbi:MAG: hypothetical protein GX458_10875, partial [Phyllobacteriaceae bacterium]|nr:hypothetical protein [Phyllobacteriaceae bacterium]